MSDHERGGSESASVGPAEMPTLSSLLALAVAVTLVAALYLARDLLIPITLAILLSFVLAPLVRLLRKAKLPRPPAALIAVLLALAVFLTVGGVIGAQVASLAQDLPHYRTTIGKKVDAVRSVTIGRLTGFLQRIDELRMSAGADRGRPGAPPTSKGPARPTPNATAAEAENAGTAASVTASPFAFIEKFVFPVLSPIATLGIVLVITLFILLQQDDLRDRFIRLVGARDLHRTTLALSDAVRRLSKYFLAQLALNSAFGVVMAAGLYFIGLPSPVLWGVVAGLFRFIPYVGAWLAAAPPLILAAAVDPGWSMFAWTLALFVIAEPLMGQVIEPFVYGHSTGLTPVSVVLATIFWTWLWGPIGLIIATPLTLCLVVLGRHVDRLEFLDVLLGDRPALSPTESFYQRMLAGDPDEVQDQAEALLRTRALSAYYDDIALPGLKLAAEDALRGALKAPQLLRIRDSVQQLIEDLDEYDDEKTAAPQSTPEVAPTEPADGVADAAGGAPAAALPAEERYHGTVLCIAGASPLDEAACSMLAQLLGKHGLSAKRYASDRSARAAIAALDLTDVVQVCISAVETSGSVGRLRLLVRRLRRQLPRTPILVGLWPRNESVADGVDVAAEIGADRGVVSLAQAIDVCIDAARAAAPPAEPEQPPQGAGRTPSASSPPVKTSAAAGG